MSWDNNDGIRLKYGTEKTAPSVIGEYRFEGPVRCFELHFDFSQLPLIAANSVVISDTYALPKNCVVERVEIFCTTDWVSPSSGMLLNIGWIDQDRVSNASANAFVDAATQAELIAGGTNIAGWVGAQVTGVPTTTSKLITWQITTQQPTAGKGFVRFFYSVY